MTGFPTVDDVDDRMRLVIGVALGIAIALVATRHVLWVGTAQAIVAVVLARRELRPWLRRILALNVFLAAIALVLPWSVSGSAMVTVESLGGASYSREGLERAGFIAWRVNVIFTVCWGLIATMPPIRLGTALLDLKLSPKLVQLVFFSFRYVDELKADASSIQRAMHARGFAFGMTRVRGTGYLLGNLLTRSLDRSERILWAMKGRGFVDRFPRFAVSQSLGPGDWVFALAILIPTVAVVVQGRVS